MGTPSVLTLEQSYDALRKQAAFATWRRRISPVCFRRGSESTMSNEKPEHENTIPPGSTPPSNTSGITCRPSNWLEAVVLLSLRERNSYGYELMQRVRVFGFEAMNPGTLYRTLRRMENDGVVESSWETSGGGPARRMYSITGPGEANLGMWATSLEQYQHSVDDFFELYGDKLPHAVDKQKDD